MNVVTIGQIGKPHGLDGWVTVHPMTYDVQRFNKLKYVSIDDEFFTKLKIEAIESLNKSLRIKFAESNSREDAERLRNRELVVDEKDVIELPDDVYFIHDLVGCDVFSKQGKHIGQVTKVIESAANDIYVIENAEKQESLIPAIPQFVKHIDINSKRIDIEEIPGLLGDED